MTTLDTRKDQLTHDIEQLLQAQGWQRQQLSQQLLSQVDVLTRTPEGLRYCYDQIERILSTGIFTHSPWEEPAHLVPTLVGGTLRAGFPNNVLEVLSEIRMVKIARGDYFQPTIEPLQAQLYLEEVIIANFNLAFLDYSEEMRMQMSAAEQKRIRTLFSFLMAHIPLQALKGKLSEEVINMANQRPIITHRLEEILALVKDHLTLQPERPEDALLSQFVQGFYAPTPATRQHNSHEAYRKELALANEEQRQSELRRLGQTLSDTGLVSEYHYLALQYVLEHYPHELRLLLHLNGHGKAELEAHIGLITDLAGYTITLHNRQVMYGLGRMLERNMLSRKPVWYALQKLKGTPLHPGITASLLNIRPPESNMTAHQLLMGGTLQVLGQPLGIGQGHNPTCQSARGISMWSQHAPGKLLNYIIDAASSDNLNFRYEGDLMEARKLTLGTSTTFDYQLDPVSIVLVPLLDRIYNEMMRQAMVKHYQEDPHVSVNPAFYGHWIQTGFASAYDSLRHAIVNYSHFIRLFLASFHPAYNGGHHFIYPVPLGIFITSAKAEFIGFHAVSLQRIDQSPNGEWRAYFYNPNNEGRQNWGQGIKPTVWQHGEQHGESSLPVLSFLSRVYAFHYNTIGVEDRLTAIPEAAIHTTHELAISSWGQKYIWL